LGNRLIAAAADLFYYEMTMKIVDSSQMRALDRDAMKRYRIPGMVLMENAALGVVRHVDGLVPQIHDCRVVIVCGPGNNGGDGLGVARHLTNRGARVRVFLLASKEKFKGDAAANLAIVKAMGIKSSAVEDERGLKKLGEKTARADLVIDAIFGTGLTRNIEGIFAEAIAAINRADGPVVAVDIPSGLNSDSGQVMGCAIRADLTVTFGLGKIGLYTGSGPEVCGGVEVADISIPAGAVTEARIKDILLDSDEVRPLVPPRPVSGHKGTFGHLLLIAGSRGKTGAGILAARGALASGCGLVSAAVPWDLNPIYEAALIEPMTIPLPGSKDGRFEVADLKMLISEAERRSAVVIGPGIGTERETAELVRELVANLEVPLLIDADGLNILAQSGDFKGRGNLLLTPHPGEMARLTGLSISEIQNDRGKAARKLAERHTAVVLLKGSGTVIAHPDGRMAINPTGSPLLATGGSGDVLAGLIGGLMAQGMNTFDAACLGAYIHGLAAQSLGYGQDRGIKAGSLCREIPQLFTFL